MLLRLISLVMLVAISTISLFPEALSVLPAGLIAWVSERPVLSLLTATALIFLVARAADR